MAALRVLCCMGFNICAPIEKDVMKLGWLPTLQWVHLDYAKPLYAITLFITTRFQNCYWI